MVRIVKYAVLATGGILGTLLLAGFVFCVWIWLQMSSFGHGFLYPSKECSASVCSFISPRGWQVDIDPITLL